MSGLILSRRKLIGGIGLLIAAPAIIRVTQLMPIRAFAVDEPLYRGVRYQSWPFGTERPEDYNGQGGMTRLNNAKMPLSHWENEIKRFSSWGEYHYEFIT